VRLWARSDDYVATQLELIFDEPIDPEDRSEFLDPNGY
jgi:hypothetical protein